MKKLFVILSLLVTGLYGCSNESETEIKAEAASVYTEDYSPNPQVPDDRNLLKKDNSVTDEKGEAILKEMKQVSESFEAGPVKMTVHDMKVIHLIPDYSLIDYFHVLTHNEEFDFVKVFVEIENTSDTKVNFAPIALLETNTGEKFDWEKDIYLEELNGEIQGRESKKGNVGFILEDSRGLEWIEITTSDVYDENENKIQDSQKIKIEL